MRKCILILTLLSLTFLLGSCATILNGSKTNINVQTSPPGAYIEVIDNKGNVIGTGVAPTKIRFPKTNGFTSPEYTIKASLANYQDKEIKIGSQGKWGAYVVGNFFLALIGYVIDPLTGGLYDPVKDELILKLEATPNVNNAAKESTEKVLAL